RIPMISTVTGRPIEGAELDADYWWRNVRQGVQFRDTIDRIARDGVGVVLELAPHPVLSYAIHECYQSAGKPVRVLASLHRERDDLTSMTASLGQLYALGHDIAWSGFYNAPKRRVDVPAYPFQLQRCWSESQQTRVGRLRDERHPLLGLPAASPSPAWEQRIDVRRHAYLADHAVRGAMVYPAAAVVETALAAAIALGDDPSVVHPVRLERLILR